jgi:uncharacterized protein (DUF433 family)
MKLQEFPLLLRNHFEQTSDVLGGKLRLRGTRVSVEQVLELIEAGVASVEIVRSFPSLSEQDVIAVERLAAHCTLTMLQPA